MTVSINTRDHLSALGISMDQARSFVMANLGSPATIYNVAKQFKIDSQMLADIVAPSVPGVNAAQVEAFFNAKGLDGKSLNASEIHTTTSNLLDNGMQALSHLFNFNQNTGILSTQSLRDAIVAKVGMTAYTKAFSPANLPGGADGVLSTTDLGFTHLGDIQATWQNVESLYFGTVTNTLTAISQSEMEELIAFVRANEPSLDLENPEVMSQLVQLIVNAYASPVTANEAPFFNNAQIAETLTSTVVQIIKLMGSHGNENLFDSMLDF